MPGKMRKPPRPAVVRRTVSRTPVRTTRPTVPARIKTNTVRRSTNVRRVQQRTVKREAVRSNALKTQTRPRPVVRPAAPPRKVMPTKPISPATRARQAQRIPPRTQIRPTAPVKPSAMTRPQTPPRTQARPVRPAQTPRPRPAASRVAATAAATAATLFALNTAVAHTDIAGDVNSLQLSITNLQDRSSLNQIRADITELDASINHVVSLLESARDKGYVYQGDMEEIAYSAIDRWQSVRQQVEDSIAQQASVMQENLLSLNPHIKRLNATLRNPTAAAPALRTTQDQINQVIQDFDSVERTLENSYDDIESDIQGLNYRLTTIHWALDQLAEAKFSLENGEDLVMAVRNRWDKEGKDDPEGILFLSNKRLIFERKEKVATKKVLFVTTSSELVQEVLVNQPLDAIKEAKAQSKGLFGHQDFMEIQFADPKLGKVSFHINGQDSDNWVTLIDRAKSGKIEEERASATGVSLSDFTGPLTSGDLMAIQNEVNELQDEMMLKDVQSDISELENQFHSLTRELADLRSHGYAVEKGLEADIEVLSQQWDKIKTRTEITLENQTKLLSDQMATIKKDLSVLMGMSANLAAARPKYISLKSAIASAEAQADAAEDTVLDQYDEFADEVESLSTHFEWVNWMLDALATASFKLLATESGVAATEAVWLRPGLEPENGILYLTDQRLLWEDRVGEYELKIAVPLQQVSDVKEETDDEAEFEILAFGFDSSEAPVPLGRFELALPVANDWLKMVGRARSGDYASDRAVAIDEAELDRIRNAPEQCSNCGAAFTAPVLRGQNDIVCEYCGVSTRI